MNIPNLLTYFCVFFCSSWKSYRLLEIRSQARSGFVLLDIGIRIERNLNIVAYTKTNFDGSICGDIGVKLRLECDEVCWPLSLESS